MTVSTLSVTLLRDGDELVGLVNPDDEESRRGDPFECRVTGVEFSRRKPLAKVNTENGVLFVRKRAEAFVRT